MLVEMAQMSAEDGMVMQIHAGSTRRNTNARLFDRHGPDMGADIPRAMNWVDGWTRCSTASATTRAFG
jgi:glucuronate isomerase